jgi:hypothetical protein
MLLAARRRLWIARDLRRPVAGDGLCESSSSAVASSCAPLQTSTRASLGAAKYAQPTGSVRRGANARTSFAAAIAVLVEVVHDHIGASPAAAQNRLYRALAPEPTRGMRGCIALPCDPSGIEMSAWPHDAHVFTFPLRSNLKLRACLTAQPLIISEVPAEVRRGLRQLERAVSLDPGFALAWSQMALIYQGAGQVPERGGTEWNAKALRASSRALTLAPDLPLVQAAAAVMSMHQREIGRTRNVDYKRPAILQRARRTSGTNPAGFMGMSAAPQKRGNIGGGRRSPSHCSRSFPLTWQQCMRWAVTSIRPPTSSAMAQLC